MSGRLEELMKLHQIDPNDTFCMYGIALEHAKFDHHDQAVHWLDQTLRVDPQYCYAYYQKAKSWLALGQEQAARETLRIGMETARQANDDHAYEEMAQLLATCGESIP